MLICSVTKIAIIYLFLAPLFQFVFNVKIQVGDMLDQSPRLQEK